MFKDYDRHSSEGTTAAPASAPPPVALSDPISGHQVKVVRDTFAMVEPHAKVVAEMFYNRLFELNPSFRSLFKGDMAEQGLKLMAVLKTAVNSLDRLHNIVPAVEALGRRHVGYGVEEEDYDTVSEALLWTLEKGLKDDFTEEVRDAWTSVYDALASTMKCAARKI
ncbi:MAG TPA: hemin receptor [Rhodospirillales bacterium]|nr:hemin receptor [Rhodospirillales bacterium]